MAKKKLTLGMAAAAAAGTAVYMAKKSQDKKNQNGTSQNDIRDKANSGWSLTQHKINSCWTFNKKDDRNSAVNNSYRNTERGKYEKNSKGIYYTNGNYEAFARPEKPEGVEEKHAYIEAVVLLLWQRHVSLFVTDRCRESIFIFLKLWTLQAGPVTVSSTRAVAISCVAVVKWRIISNVYGIFSIVFHPLKFQVLRFWMNFIG